MHKLFPRATKEHLAAIRNKKYNITTITQLGICKVNLELNNKHKNVTFFLVVDNSLALLGMFDIETLDL